MLDAYRLLRPTLFRLDPEAAHHAATGALARALATRPARMAARAMFAVDAPELKIRRWGIHFPNPIGLGAGFDKEATLFDALGALGFGFVEIGTVTAQAQPGNPSPRLFRLPADGALLNRMGFNNPGAEAVARTLARRPAETVLGVNVGKSKAAALEDAVADYLASVDLLLPFARYLVVNVSSPNTPGLRSLQDARPLRELLEAVVARVRERRPEVPVLVKLAPDLGDEQVEEAVGIATDAGAGGVVAVNTTISRAGLRTPAAEVEGMGAGGISGDPLRARALEVVGRIHRVTGGRLPIIGVGGIRTVDDVWDRLRAGASLVQLWTALVYEGPGLARDLNRGMLKRMRREGVRSVDELVGSAHR